MTHARVSIFTSLRDAETRWRHYETLQSPYVYQTFDWALRWYETIGRLRHHEPVLVDVMGEDETALAFLPMAIEKRRLGKALIWLGGDVTDYQAPLLTAEGPNRLNEEALGILWSDLRRQRSDIDYADLKRQPAVIGDLPNPFFNIGRVAHAEHALSTRLVGDWPTYYAGKRGKKTRHNDRRKHRRLESMGNLSFVIATAPEEIDAQVEAMLVQKDRYVERLGQINGLRQRGHDAFLKRMASDLDVRDDTFLCALKLDDQILAVQWGVRHDKRFYSIIASYDDGPLSRYSTGDILLRELLAWCFENGIESLDFTRGDEPYKLAWCDHTLNLASGLIPFSLLGFAAVSAQLAMTSLRRRARSSDALRGTVAAIRTWTRHRLTHPASPCSAADQQTGSDRS